jgi:6-pyruvoyltetrahydropterin/6-carboxytetrahydropterin synthase
MMHVTRRYRFCASHRLHAASLSETENRELYGQCDNPHGHGHNYLLEVGVAGPLAQASGSAVNVMALDSLVRKYVIDAMDHKNLNAEAPGLAGLVPTTENIALDIRKTLQDRWRTAFPQPWPRLEKVRIYETGRNSVELCTSD